MHHLPSAHTNNIFPANHHQLIKNATSHHVQTPPALLTPGSHEASHNADQALLHKSPRQFAAPAHPPHVPPGLAVNMSTFQFGASELRPRRSSRRTRAAGAARSSSGPGGAGRCRGAWVLWPPHKRRLAPDTTQSVGVEVDA